MPAVGVRTAAGTGSALVQAHTILQEEQQHMSGKRLLVQSLSYLAMMAMCSQAIAADPITTSTKAGDNDPFAAAVNVLRLPLVETFYEKPRVRVAENVNMRQVLLLLQQLEADQLTRGLRRTESGDMVPFRTVSVVPMRDGEYGVQISGSILGLEQKDYSFGTIQFGRRTLMPGEGDRENNEIKALSIYDPDNPRRREEFR
jgi:hypothetical protein